MGDGDIEVVFVKPGSMHGELRPSLKDYDHAANQIMISRIEDCEMHEQIVYASRKFGDERKMLNSFVIIRGEGDEKKELWVAKALPSCRCSVNRDAQGVKLALVQYMECLPPLKAVDETLDCVWLRWATTDGGKDENEVGRALDAND